jgi:biofilm PGA synthesis N-glycosyltransferase PgaC
MTISWPVALVAISASFVVYVLFGYPLLLGGLAWWKRRGNTAQPAPLAGPQKTVSILLPVRDGEKWIRQKLISIGELRYPRELLQILVISDGSMDATDQIAQEFENVDLIRVPRSNKACALNAGLKRASGEIVFFTDVRQPLDPDCLANLVAAFDDPKVGVASGEMIYIQSGDSHEKDNIGQYWTYEKWIRTRQSQIDSMVGAAGCVYAVRRELAVEIPPEILLDDVYQPLAAFFRGYRSVVVDTAKAYDYPASLNTEFRRKVRTQAGVYQVIGAYPALLTPANRMWGHFLSHKLGRLLLPFALMVLFGASLALSAPWSTALIAAQLLFYALAIIDLWIPDRSRVKTVTSMIRTFVVLMIAAVCAISILFLPSRVFWTQPTNPRAHAEAGK